MVDEAVAEATSAVVVADDLVAADTWAAEFARVVAANQEAAEPLDHALADHVPAAAAEALDLVRADRVPVAEVE